MHDAHDKVYHKASDCFVTRDGYAYDHNGANCAILTTQGYMKAGRSRWYVHRVVYECFGGCRVDGLLIHHRNGNKTDNRIENLELVTAMEHMSRHTRLSENDLRIIRDMYTEGVKTVTIARLYAISSSYTSIVGRGLVRGGVKGNGRQDRTRIGIV